MGHIQYVKAVTLRNRKSHTSIYTRICNMYMYTCIKERKHWYHFIYSGGGMNQASDKDLVTVEIMTVIFVKLRL